MKIYYNTNIWNVEYLLGNFDKNANICMKVAICGTKYSYFYSNYNNSKILVYKVAWKSFEVFIKLINILRKIGKIALNNDKTKFLLCGNI